MKTTVKEAFNIPNILCYIRILLIPFFSYFLLSSNDENYTGSYLAALLILLSGLTDLLDGFIARRFNMITELGKAIDPIADKLTQFCIAVCLSIKYEGVFVLVSIVFIKELSMGICSLLLIKKRQKKLDGAMWFGKVSTAVFYITMFLIIAIPSLSNVVVYTLISIATGFVIMAFALYVRVFYRMARNRELK